MQVNDEVSRAIDTIRTYEHDVREAEGRLKLLRERAKELLEATPEYQAVEEAVEALKIARQALKYKLLDKLAWNDLQEEIATEAEVVKGSKHILSEHLVAYHALTQERQIELDEGGEAREVILTGKLGKDQKYQESLFKNKGDKS